MKILNDFIENWPKLSFMVFVKILWVTGFFWQVYIIQGQVPSLKQWLLGSIYVIVTLPANYWLTYEFGGKKQ